MKETCEFNLKERCTWMGETCLHPEKECFATVRKGVGVAMPKMTVMQPTVINVSNEVPPKNVAPQEIDGNLSKEEESVINAMKEAKEELSSLSGIPSRVLASEELLCKSGNPVKYRDCPDYNTEFCRTECSFGPKEKKMDDVNLDYQNPEGK